MVCSMVSGNRVSCLCAGSKCRGVDSGIDGLVQAASIIQRRFRHDNSVRTPIASQTSNVEPGRINWPPSRASHWVLGKGRPSCLHIIAQSKFLGSDTGNRESAKYQRNLTGMISFKLWNERDLRLYIWDRGIVIVTPGWHTCSSRGPRNVISRLRSH